MKLQVGEVSGQQLPDFSLILGMSLGLLGQIYRIGVVQGCLTIEPEQLSSLIPFSRMYFVSSKVFLEIVKNIFKPNKHLSM